MHNELEQPAITNKRLLVHSLHAANAMFSGYNWSPLTLLERVGEGRLDAEMTSYLACVITAIDTIPATQKYTSDYWIVPQRKAEDGTIIYGAHGGEDFQVANASSARWSPDKPALPSGRNDCESFAHANLSRMLGFIELAGGKRALGALSKDGWDINSIRERVYLDAIQGDPSKMPKAIPKDSPASKSLVEFAKQACKPTNDNVALDSMVVAACIMSSSDFNADLILGGAYAASRTSSPEERKPGGHAYSICRLGDHTALMEGTAPVLNRMYAETTEHAR